MFEVSQAHFLSFGVMSHPLVARRYNVFFPTRESTPPTVYFYELTPNNRIEDIGWKVAFIRILFSIDLDGNMSHEDTVQLPVGQ